MPPLSPKKTIALLNYILDGILSLSTILIGRLLPKLIIPQVDLTNKTAIITGANSGIGYSLALSLARRNATVYLACSNSSKAREAASAILDVTGVLSSQIHVLSLDTSSLASVRKFTETWDSSKQIDLLFHNAGITGPPANQHTTPEGLGTIYATNFAGSFLLTSRLEPHLSPSARVIFTSSTSQYGSRPHRIFTLPRLAPTGDSNPQTQASTPTQNSCKPPSHTCCNDASMQLALGFPTVAKRTRSSYTSTPIFDRMPSQPWYKDPYFWALKAYTSICVPVDEGAATGLWLATTEDERVVGEGRGGECWDRCVRRSTAADVLSEETLARMWKQWEVDFRAKWE